jgi:hypothetical protein
VEALRTGELIYARPVEEDKERFRTMVARPGGSEHEIYRTVARDDRAAVRCGGGDPARCVLGTWIGQTVTLSRIDVATGHTEPPFFHGSSRGLFAVSPDGMTIALLSCAPTFTLIDTRTGQSRVVTTTPTSRCLQDATFTPDGKTLLMTGIYVGTTAYGLLEVDLEGRGRLLRGTTNEWMNAPRVSNDGLRVAYFGEIYETNIWILEPRGE